MQVFDASKQQQYPQTQRYINTFLAQPTALQVLGAQVQPPQKAYSYTEDGPNKWGEGPSPLAPIQHLFSQPWSGTPCFCSTCYLPNPQDSVQPGLSHTSLWTHLEMEPLWEYTYLVGWM